MKHGTLVYTASRRYAASKNELEYKEKNIPVDILQKNCDGKITK